MSDLQHQKTILVEGIPVEDRQAFRIYVATGKGEPEFVERFNSLQFYRSTGDKVLALIFTPFAEAIRKTDARIKGK